MQVSWLRDTFPIPMLLALNNLTNIADERFAAFHVPGTERFSLRLARAHVGDSGFYECQVATREGEPSLFRLIYLDVVSEFEDYIRAVTFAAKDGESRYDKTLLKANLVIVGRGAQVRPLMDWTVAALPGT